MLEGLTSFGPEGGDAAGGGDTAPETQPGGEQAPREPHSRTRAHDEQGRFAGPAPKPPEAKEKKEPATPPPTAPQRLKFKVPRDDGSGDEELELTAEDAGKRLAEARQLARARDEERKAREQAQKEGQALRRLTEGLKRREDRAGLFRKFVRDSGLSAEEAEEFFAEALHGELQDQALTPEQRRIRELEAEKEAREAADAQTKADAEFKQFEETVRKKEAEYSKVWGEALEKTGLPKTPELLADIARHHLVNKKQGLSLTADELASYASANLDKSLGARLQGLTAESFAKRFPDVAKAWQQRLDDMPAEDFVKAHPKQARALLKHFREQARTRRLPSVGAPRPADRPLQTQQQDDERPRFYNPWDAGR